MRYITMDWKKFKKKYVSLNYTIMLLPHSQQQPIHFKIPVWGFGVVFLLSLTITGTALFSAGASHQLRQVEQEKQLLETERQQLSEQKLQIEQEYETLAKINSEQGQNLKTLEQKTDQTIEELKKLTKRENEIRDQIGLEDLDPAAENPSNSISVNSIPYNRSAPEPEYSADIIEKNLELLQSSVSLQSKNYDIISSEIQTRKEAAAAERSRKLSLRSSVVNYALQFVGNKYVYGGNDPNTGADCSGFTKYVLAHAANVHINRSSASQATQGKTVSRENVRPGDLVFYGNGSSVDHVALYIGNGQIVHASSAKTGIKISNWDYRSPVRIANMLGD